jgi:hypothetical protein
VSASDGATTAGPDESERHRVEREHRPQRRGHHREQRAGQRCDEQQRELRRGAGLGQATPVQDLRHRLCVDHDARDVSRPVRREGGERRAVAVREGEIDPDESDTPAQPGLRQDCDRVRGIAGDEGLVGRRAASVIDLQDRGAGYLEADRVGYGRDQAWRRAGCRRRQRQRAHDAIGGIRMHHGAAASETLEVAVEPACLALREALGRRCPRHHHGNPGGVDGRA